MAALLRSRIFLGTKSSLHELKPRNYSSLVIVSSCQGGEPPDTPSRPKSKKESKQEKKLPRNLFGRVGEFGKALKETMSPQRKGDWKDVVLMSLSFAVYVYISQQLVCAYCAWMSMFRTSSW